MYYYMVALDLATISYGRYPRVAGPETTVNDVYVDAN